MMRNPGELVPRLRKGDDAAWREFIEAFAPLVPIVSRPLGLDADEQDDVLAEMTLTAFRSIHNLRDPSRLVSWTYTIARRAAIAQWKGRLDGLEATVMDQFPSGAPSVDHLLIAREDRMQLRAALAGLKGGCRRLIDDLFLKEPRRSYREISERYEMPVGSIGPTLARCLEALRREWSRSSKSVSKRV